MSDTVKQTKSHGGKRDLWTGQYAFLLAAVGSAIGLGNIWRFPGVAYTNGGGAFILPYIIALLLVGIPVLLLDYALGHKYRGSAPLTFRRLTKKAEFLGWWQVAVSFIILVYYAVIIAWAAMYAVYSVRMAWGQDATAFFLEEFLQVEGDKLISTTPVLQILIPLVLVWLFVFVALARGVSRGVEKVNRIFIPLLVLLFLVLVGRALFLPGAVEGLSAFFTPDWNALTNGHVWLAAFSQIFFSMSIAFGIMLTYASYLPRRSNLTGTGLVAGFANSSFELLAGIGVFATLGFMAHQSHTTVGDLEGLTGPILSFVTFPTIISLMPGGPLFGVLFFTSLTLAGITSLLSLLQVVSGAIQDKFNLPAKSAAICTTVVSAGVSISLFSTTTGLTNLDVVDAFINNIGVVSSAIAMSLVAFFVAPRIGVLRRHLNLASSIGVPRAWNWIVGLVVPTVLAVMLFQALVSYFTEGYGGFAATSANLMIFGWGTLALGLVLSAIFTWLPWSKHAKAEDIVRFKGEE